MEEDTVEERLRTELGTVSVAEVSNAQIETIRRKIKAGEFPAFMETDYKAGYYEYARSRISQKFVGYRKRVNGHRIRSLYPMLYEARVADGVRASEKMSNNLSSPESASPPPPEAPTTREWREMDNDAESMAYTDKRMTDHITAAIRLHGSAKVAFGKATWEDVRDQAHTIVNTAVDGAAKQEASVA